MASALSNNTYKIYKSGTTQFTTWLVETARSCGGIVEPENAADTNAPTPTEGVSTSKTKNKKKKKKKGNGESNTPPLSSPSQSKYIISTRDFPRLASIIANYNTTNRIIIPNPIWDLLGLVISLRKEVAQWISRISRNGNRYEHDHEHQHFIEVLEETREILRPCCGPKEETTVSEDVQDAVPNKFASLNIEEPSEQSQIPVPPKPTPRQEPKSSSKATFDVETHNDALFACLCFFQDFEAIRTTLRLAWSNYRDRTGSLITASLLTNTAIELIQTAVQELLEVTAKLPQIPSGSGLTWWVYSHISKADVYHREQPDDLMNMDTYEDAEWCGLPVSIIMEDWLSTVSPKQLSFMKNYSNLSLASDYKLMGAREKFQEDRLFLNLLFSHFHNVALLQLEFPPAVDDITKAFRTVGVAETESVPLWLVLALQLHMDCQHILRDGIGRGFQDLSDTNSQLTNKAKEYFRISPKIIGRKHTWHGNNDPQLQKLKLFEDEWLKRDFVSYAIHEQSKQRLSDLGIEIPPFFLLKHHPTVCGLLQYWLLMAYRDIGVSFANSYDTIIGAAHLYNAAIHSGYLHISWTDMDFILQFHRSERLFVGTPPNNPADYFKRFSLVAGASAANFASNRRSGRVVESNGDKRQRKLRYSFPIHDIFKARYCAKDIHSSLTTRSIQELIDSILSRNPEFHTVVEFAADWKKTGKYDSAKLLRVLAIGLKAESNHLNFDYLFMGLRCSKILSEIRQHFISNADSEVDALVALRARDAGAARIMLPLEEHINRPSLSWYLQSEAMPPDDAVTIRLVSNIFLADPEATAAAVSFLSDASSRSSLLRLGGVSLEAASGMLGRFIQREGQTGVRETVIADGSVPGERY